MNVRGSEARELPLAGDMTQRVDALDWSQISQDLDTRGCAVAECLMTPEECHALANLYGVDGIFRSRVVMERHGFGRGEYQYFRYPLPGLIAGLRSALYPHLVPTANRWNADMGIEVRYPADHAGFIALCHGAGQVRPMPLLLQYGRMITTACIRTYTGSMFSRSRPRYCCPSRTATLRGANSC